MMMIFNENSNSPFHIEYLGLHDIDEYIQAQLLLSAINITTHVLCESGTSLPKYSVVEM